MQFTLKKDHFYSKGLKLGLHFSDIIHFTAKFDTNCLYQPLDSEGDLNKLFGLSDNITHIKDSIRVAWRAVDDQIELWAYSHVNKEKQYKKICTVDVDDSFYCTILIGKDNYFIDVFYKGQKYSTSMIRQSKWNVNVRYILWPYFGGTHPAPHDMNLGIWQSYDHKNLILYIR